MDLTPSDCPEVTEVIEVTAEVIVSAFLHLDPTSSHGKLECIQLIDQFRKPMSVHHWFHFPVYNTLMPFLLAQVPMQE